LAFVADFGTRNFHLKTKFDMKKNTSINHENGNDANRLLAEVTPRQKFVSEMQSIISKIDAIDKETPWQHVEPEWWLEMMGIRKKAFDAVQKFKK
jgi:hypothetical protein